MGIHKEDQKAVEAVGEQLQKIEELIAEIVCKLREGGRLLYIGAGTSGRLGVLDASECPPTFFDGLRDRRHQIPLLQRDATPVSDE